MTPEDLAHLHALAFTFVPRPWSAAEFASLLGLDSTLIATCPEGFALGQIAGPEATLLTLAVHPDHRRRGLGRELVLAFEAQARDRGAEDSFLEVAETNGPARALYAALSYVPVGRRPGYYHPPEGQAIDALVLRKALHLPGAGVGGKTN